MQTNVNYTTSQGTLSVIRKNPFHYQFHLDGNEIGNEQCVSRTHTYGLHQTLLHDLDNIHHPRLLQETELLLLLVRELHEFTEQMNLSVIDYIGEPNET